MSGFWMLVPTGPMSLPVLTTRLRKFDMRCTCMTSWWYPRLLWLTASNGILRRLATRRDRRLAIVAYRRSHRFDERGQGRLGVGGHLHIDHLEALEVLIVRLGVEVDRADADEPGIGIDARRVLPDAAVLAVVREGIHGPPEIRELEADDDVGVAHGARRRGQVVRGREIHAPALVDDERLKE